MDKGAIRVVPIGGLEGVKLQFGCGVAGVLDGRHAQDTGFHVPVQGPGTLKLQARAVFPDKIVVVRILGSADFGQRVGTNIYQLSLFSVQIHGHEPASLSVSMIQQGIPAVTDHTGLRHVIVLVTGITVQQVALPVDPDELFPDIQRRFLKIPAIVPPEPQVLFAAQRRGKS